MNQRAPELENPPRTIGEIGISTVYHVAPLHYLPAIARCGRLRSKPELRRFGYSTAHFRKTSWQVDTDRGFECFVHLSLSPEPPILLSKLRRGFPHIQLCVPIGRLPASEVGLCAFNIGRSRGTYPQDSAQLGYRHDGARIPYAFGSRECLDLLAGPTHSLDAEVLFRDGLDLPSETTVHAYDDEDANLVKVAATRFDLAWSVSLESVKQYRRDPQLATAMLSDFDRFLGDPAYRGSGLDYDNCLLR